MIKFVKDLSQLHQLGQKPDQERDKEKLDLKALLRTYKVFGRHYKKHLKVLAVAYLSLFVTIGVAVLQPWPLKLVLDHLILKQPLPETLAFLNPLFSGSPRLLLFLLALSIILITLLEAIFSYINKFWISSTGDRITADIRERVFAHLQRLSISFHETARSGDVILLLNSDVKAMRGILIDFPQDFTQRVVTFGVYIALMLVLDWRLSLIALMALPLMYFLAKYFGAGLKKAAKKQRRISGDITSILVENIKSMALVQAYGREESESARFRAGNRENLEIGLRSLRLQRAYSRLSDFFVTLSTAGVLYWGGRHALGGDILPGTLVIFVAYTREIFGAFEKLNGLLMGLASSQVPADRLIEVVENDMVMQDDPKAIPATHLKGRIEFRNVSFAYKRGKEVLKNLNFVVEPGETVALVGPSGAGKSTLISLLLRFYDPQQGQILIDGQDIRKFTLKSLRGQMTIVLQDATLFCQTVRENIAFGKIGATEEEIIQAAQLAEAHDFIMERPEGYGATIDEDGNNLSGGQKQRINIARAIIRNTPIVIMDEPVTGLDARAEAKVNAAIHRLTRGKTTFIIAHKFSTIAGADKILLLEEGQIAHQGAHEELLRTSPPYRELYELQFGRQRKAAPVEATSNGNNGIIESEHVVLNPA